MWTEGTALEAVNLNMIESLKVERLKDYGWALVAHGVKKSYVIYYAGDKIEPVIERLQELVKELNKQNRLVVTSQT